MMSPSQYRLTNVPCCGPCRVKNVYICRTCRTCRTCHMTHRGHGYTFLQTEWCVLEWNDWDLSGECKNMKQSESILLRACVLNGECRACSRKSETQTRRRNGNRNRRWASQDSFQTAYLKSHLFGNRLYELCGGYD